MKIDWIDDFRISVRTENDVTVISANKEGLLSLAEILKRIAEEEGGTHLHLDEHNSLDDGSAELIIEKRD